jgi:hypothetical protein
MSKNSGILAGLTLALVSSIATARPAHADEVPASVDRTVRTIQAEGKAIMAWVYPTVAFSRVGTCGWGQTRDGFDVGCSFFYKDDGDPGVRRLTFHLNAGGLITSISDAGGTSFWPPFATMRLTKDFLAQAARDQLETNNNMDSDTRAILALLATNPEPEDILALILDVEMVRRG